MVRPNPETQTKTEMSWHTNRGGPAVFGSVSWDKMERQWLGSRTPDYGIKKRKKLWLDPLPYRSDLIRRVIPMSLAWSEHYDWPLGVSEYYDLHLSYHGANTPPVDYFGSEAIVEANNRALRSMNKKLQGVQANVALMFTERKQTATMLASSATRILQAARSLKRADFRGFARSLNLSPGDTAIAARQFKRVEKTPVDKRLANHWLEYVFGWLPLLSDTHDVAELLAESVSAEKEPKGSVTATARLTRSSSFRDPQTGSGHMFADYDARLSVTARIKAQYQLESEARSILSKTGISNPLSLAWEMLPFSFVVDWFLPVGQYLDSLTAFDGFTVKGSTSSTLENAVATWRLGVYNQPGYAWGKTFVSPASAEATQSRYIRVLGMPNYQFPRIRSPIGDAPLKRFLTATALLTQLFKADLDIPSTRTPRSFRVNASW